MESPSQIAEFYRDRSIFITGATGFMGKVLVEKLLRSCPGIKRLYLLMRPSKGKDVQTRLQELLANEVNHSFLSTYTIITYYLKEMKCNSFKRV